VNPKVSICVPNLNTRPYLPERFQSIFEQTFQDWELLVYDSYSDDGAWDYIQQLAAKEPRMQVWQGPRQGTPGSWNPCIAKARGTYVYVATSDDTMAPDCLEKMVAALESHPECGLCQCRLEVIDEKSAPLPELRQWSHYSLLGAYDETLIRRKNIRMAPHDGLLHPVLLTIYTSITQLLIRKTVFDRIGLFELRWGSISDFEWGMRAALVENCIYIPDAVATWRIHSGQATQNVNTPDVRLKMIDMARHAFARATTVDKARLDHIDINQFIYFLERDWIGLSCQAAQGMGAKLRFLLGQITIRPQPVIDHLVARSCERFRAPLAPTSEYARLKMLFRKYQVTPPVFE
jgi:glycosyltransferase involved in cell wall biosynthesis